MEEQLKALIKEAVKEVIKEMNLSNPREEVLSVKELAEWLNVSPAWISVNKYKKHIPHFEAGGDKFYRTDIEKWIEENKNEVNASKIILSNKVNTRVCKSKLRIS